MTNQSRNSERKFSARKAIYFGEDMLTTSPEQIPFAW